MIYYYSAEGNSRHIARQLANLTGDEASDITHCKGIVNLTGSQIGFVFPVHCWGVPPVMRKFLSSISPTPNIKYVWAVMTCGDDIGMADRMLAADLKKKHLQPDSVFSITMPNTYLLMKGFRLDSEEVVRQKLNRADEKVKHIARLITDRSKMVDVHRGSFPRFKTHVIYPFFFRRKISSGRWIVNSGLCTHCGLCQKACPVGNISINQQSRLPEWSNRCVQCLACFHNCPHRAIDCRPYTLNAAQYTFPFKD